MTAGALCRGRRFVGEVFNFGTGRELPIREVVDVVLAATGKQLPVELVEERLRPAGSEVDRLCASVEKAGARLGGGCDVFEDGLPHDRLDLRGPTCTGPRSTASMEDVVVLAGGAGTRLRPYTTVLPKPLMPVGDMPVLEILLRQVSAAGFER